MVGGVVGGVVCGVGLGAVISVKVRCWVVVVVVGVVGVVVGAGEYIREGLGAVISVKVRCGAGWGGGGVQVQDWAGSATTCNPGGHLITCAASCSIVIVCWPVL